MSRLFIVTALFLFSGCGRSAEYVVDGVPIVTSGDAAAACVRLIEASQPADAAMLSRLVRGGGDDEDYCIGRVALHLHDYVLAISRLGRVCGGGGGGGGWGRGVDGRGAPACLALADANMLDGRFEAAVAALRHALAVAPGYAPALLALGRLLDSRGDTRGAAAALGAYWRAVPGWVDVVDKGDLLTALANAHVSLGDVAAARAWLGLGDAHEPVAFMLRRGLMLLAATGDSEAEMAGWLRDCEGSLRDAMAAIAAEDACGGTGAACSVARRRRPLAPNRVGGGLLYVAMFQLGSVAPVKILAAAAYTAAFPMLDSVSVGISCARPRHSRVVVGFLSRFLYHHPVGRTFARLIAQLPRAEFEVVVFLFPQVPDDAVSRGILRAADRVVWLPELGDMASIHRCAGVG